MGDHGADHSLGGVPMTRVDAHDLGPALAPALMECCRNRLSELRWFRTDWQTGGAATAFGKFASEDGSGPREVVVKVPVGPREYRVMTALSDRDTPTPRVSAHGTELGGHDIAWVVMERFPGSPMSAKLHRDVIAHLVEAGVRFQEACGEVMPGDAPIREHDWEKLVDRGRECVRANEGTVPHAAQWLSALKHVQRVLPKLVQAWSGRDKHTWCHGDLHPGNCLHRPEGSAWGPSRYVLIDFAEVHRGHWVEDAVYLERQFWGRPQILDGLKPVSLMAQARRERGLDTSGDYGALANVRRVLMAATTPAFLEREGHPAYLNATLEVIEKLLPMIGK